MREYKAVTPNETISIINSILERIGIKTKRIVFGKQGICNSVRLIISGPGFDNLDIGTNGKGMSEAYAIASAYGEMMERLENKMLLFYIKYASPEFRMERAEYHNLFPDKLSFRYFPDEEYIRISGRQLCEWGRKLLPKSPLFENSLLDTKYSMPFVPFYDVFSDKEEKLPYDLIRFAAGSTGLCAGNVSKEAILQGINEIFERYVLQHIYLDQPVLPTIPLCDIASDDILYRFGKLSEDRNWRFIIKDCSLGQGFPVIGLLVIDDVNGTYTFRLGSDTCPEVALRRCFTEIFQGTDINDSAFMPIDVSDTYDMALEYKKNLMNGRGRFPSCIFLGKTRRISKNQIIDKETISENFDSVIKWLKDHSYKLYIRDNSFLGFPAYHIYIPGLSDVDSRLFNIRECLLHDSDYYKLPMELRSDSLTSEESRAFIFKYSCSKQANIDLVGFSWSRYRFINRNLLLALVSFRLGKTSEACRFMNDFLCNQQKSGQKLGKYYYCIRDYFALSNGVFSQKDVTEILGTLYGENTAKEVMCDCSSPNNIMSALPLPKCFECSKCALNKECGYEALIELESKIQKIQKLNLICQSDIRILFYGVS